MELQNEIGYFIWREDEIIPYRWNYRITREGCLTLKNYNSISKAKKI